MTADLPCQELVELITAYLEGELPAETRSRFDAHLEICEGCRTYLDQMRHTVALPGTLRGDDIRPDMMARLMTAFRDWRAYPPEPER